MLRLLLLTLTLTIISLLWAEDKEAPKEEKPDPIKQAHNYFANDCNNQVWALLDKQDRTPADDEQLLYLAFASAYHWSQVGSEQNHQRAEWLIARVYTVLANKTEALQHALRCQQLTEQNSPLMEDFDLAYCQECLARAYALNKDKAQFAKYFQAASQAAEKIVNEEDRTQFLSDLSGGNWFGMKQ